MTLDQRQMAEWPEVFSQRLMGSDTVAERLVSGNIAIALLATTIPAGAILVTSFAAALVAPVFHWQKGGVANA